MADPHQETVTHRIEDFRTILDSIKANFSDPNWGLEHEREETAYLHRWCRDAIAFLQASLPNMGVAREDGSYLLVKSEVDPILQHLRDLQQLCRPNRTGTRRFRNSRRPTQYLRYIGEVQDLGEDKPHHVTCSPLTVLIHLAEISHLILHPITVGRPEASLLEYIALSRDSDTSQLVREIRNEVEIQFDKLSPPAQVKLCKESKDLLDHLEATGPTTFNLKRILDENVNYTTDSTFATAGHPLVRAKPVPFLPIFGEILQPIELAGRTRSFGRRLQHSLSHRQNPQFSNRKNGIYALCST